MKAKDIIANLKRDQRFVNVLYPKRIREEVIENYMKILEDIKLYNQTKGRW
jgi:hypothetical protein